MKTQLFVFFAVALTAVSLPRAGFAEQPLKQLPEDVVSFSLSWVALPQAMAEATKNYGPLVGISWGLVKGSSNVVGRVLNLVDEGPSFERKTQPQHRHAVFTHGEEARSPAWLNVNNGGSRTGRHEPALLRYTF